MKKAIIFSLLAVCLVLAAMPIYSGPFPKYAIAPGSASAMFAKEYRSYADVIKEAPILVEVEITKHKGDLPNYFYGSLYEAKVLTCYKNETTKKLDVIELVQDGNSEVTFDGYTLFQTGDRLLLPLLSCEKNSVLSDTHPEYYRIYGAAQTAMQIADSDAGDVCFTFLPILEDLPTATVTPEMWDSARAIWDRKYVGATAETYVPKNPGSVLVSRDTLEEWIEKELAP